MKHGLASWIASWGLILLSPAAFADPAPDCYARGKRIEIDNGQVLEWKTQTHNQFTARANVEGRVVRLFGDRSGHAHYELQLGPERNDTLEVVYQKAAGPCAQARIGAVVQACGDYITSFRDTPKYPKSPSGALIHWVHASSDESRHDHGFVIMNGDVCGL